MQNPPALYYSNGEQHQDSEKVYLKIRNALFQAHDKVHPVGIRLEKDPNYLLCILACLEFLCIYL